MFGGDDGSYVSTRIKLAIELPQAAATEFCPVKREPPPRARRQRRAQQSGYICSLVGWPEKQMIEPLLCALARRGPCEAQSEPPTRGSLAVIDNAQRTRRNDERTNELRDGGN